VNYQCKDFQRTQTCCKHIALVILEKKPIQFFHLEAVWDPQNDALEACDANSNGNDNDDDGDGDDATGNTPSPASVWPTTLEQL
jgi:hypothetical protein